MRNDFGVTPNFDRELELVLRQQAFSGTRARLPFALSALGRLRSFSSLAGHAGVAVVMSAVLLLLSPATLSREAQLPAVSAPPPIGYLAQYGVTQSADQRIADARNAGFEVAVITTYVPDRESHGEIVAIRHVSHTVGDVPVNHRTRGPLFIVIGLTISDAGKNAD
jgi:hypothetical protein